MRLISFLRFLPLLTPISALTLRSDPPAPPSGLNSSASTTAEAAPQDIYDDPFYQPAPGYESAAPGTILKWRRTPRPITLIDFTPIYPKDAWQIQYRTQNSVGEPEATIVTVLVPYNANKKALFAQAYFSDAAYAGCNPSFALQQGDRLDNIFTQLQTAVVVAALSDGFYVSVADDAGPQAAFPSGPQLGYAQLDSIRAVLKSGQFTGLDAKPTVTLNGYSGGGISAAWAGELHPIYAPELKIDGIALGGITPNLTQLLTKGPSVSFAIVSVLGMSHDYKNLSTWLNDNLAPRYADEFRLAEKQCILSNNNYDNKKLDDFFKRGAKSLWEDPVPRSVVDTSGIMGQRSTPKAPWYLYHTVGDGLSPVELTDNLYRKYCLAGADIFYERNMISIEHAQEALVGYPGAYAWMRDIHTGRSRPKPGQGCRQVAVSRQTLYAIGAGLLTKGLFQNFLALLGVPINIFPK